MPSFPADLTLRGTLVELRPLRADDAPALVEAVQDGAVHDLWYAGAPRPQEMEEAIAARLAQRDAGTMIPFTAVRLVDRVVLGMTSLYNIARDLPAVDIGWTWNRASARGSGTNADSKRLLLGYAFDEARCLRVGFWTHVMNLASQAAIERLGARKEGVLRQNMLDRDGHPRDSVVYSILAHEWPMVRRELDRRVAAHQ